MHNYKDLPFEVASKAELIEAFERQRIQFYNRKAEVEYMGFRCELSYDYNSGHITYQLRVYPTLSGTSIDGRLSRRNTAEWMKELYTSMKAEYGEPSIPRLFYGHLNKYDEVETEEKDIDGLNPSRAGESVRVYFDNVELSHGWFDNDGDTTSRITVTFRPEG